MVFNMSPKLLMSHDMLFLHHISNLDINCFYSSWIDLRQCDVVVYYGRVVITSYGKNSRKGFEPQQLIGNNHNLFL